MRQQGIRELVGRAMIDPDFLAELVRTPEAVMAEYQLSQQEREALLQAVAKRGRTPSHHQLRSFEAALVKRWAT